MDEGEQRRGDTAAADRRTPTDVLAEEILTRIPVKSLLRNYSLVCRELFQLISSPRFTRIHLNASNKRCRRILLDMDDGIVDYEDAPGAFYDPKNKISPKIPFPPGFPSEALRILGSCDGLICLFWKHGNKLSVFNPSTRKYAVHCIGKELSRSLSVNGVTWFGRHPSTGEYTLVVVKGGVYKLNSLRGSYLPIYLRSRVDGYTMDGIGTMLHGTLHWAAWFRNHNNKLHNAVFGYDLRKNETVEIPIPEYFQFRHGDVPFTLGVADGCLFVIFKNASKVFELWIMREYGVGESWTKYANIEGYEQCDRLAAPLGFCPGGDLMVEADMGDDVEGKFCHRMLKKYSFMERVSSLVKDIWSSNNEAIAYVDSLVSPDQVMYNWRDID